MRWKGQSAWTQDFLKSLAVYGVQGKIFILKVYTRKVLELLIGKALRRVRQCTREKACNRYRIRP